MSIFEELEDVAGHQLTMVAQMLAGVTTYCCEHCGALLKISSSGRSEPELVLFHVPARNASTAKRCNTELHRVAPREGHVLLRDKLQGLILDGFMNMDDDA